MASDVAPLDSIYSYGMVRVAARSPLVSLAQPDRNASKIFDGWKAAHEQGAALVVFPELSLTGYSIDDLLLQDALLDATEAAIASLTERSRELRPICVVGAPIRVRGHLYNAAVVMHRGTILGVVPKSYLPNYREFYEARHFRSGAAMSQLQIALAGHDTPFGTDLLFAARDFPQFVLSVEICEDVWVPIPPSAHAALSGATVVANLSASNITIGKSEYRHALCKAHSGRCMSAYIYSAAGLGESTTDLAWDGHAMIYENGVLLGESERFAAEGSAVTCDIDLELIRQERMRHGTFADCAAINSVGVDKFRRIHFSLSMECEHPTGLLRPVSRFPFVPADMGKLREHCFEAFNIQVHGLRQRLSATRTSHIVIGLSGGLDSTHALIVATRAMDALELPRENILAYTLPAFGTTDRTKRNAWSLMRALGVSADEIDVTPACLQMLKDIGHPFWEGVPAYDVTFENVQAGARTSLLFRLANHRSALVLGTGDLSEIALGWCTYGVGDQMSHYNVNSSVPKTLIQHLIRWVVAESLYDADSNAVLLDILSTEISPELLPADLPDSVQRTEDIVGPYELQDFYLYYCTRHGFRPSKIAFLALHAWGSVDKGEWPASLPCEARHAYDLDAIVKWLDVFVRRFFEKSQFKRSALPNGPKVSSGGSLSPRGDWRAPSDSSSEAWLAELTQWRAAVAKSVCSKKRPDRLRGA